MDLKEVDVVTVNDVEYMIVDKINEYSYLSAVNNPKDIRIFKDLIENGEEYLVSITEQNEIDKALLFFYQKNS